MRGRGDLDNDLVSILDFMGVDSLFGECSSTSTPWASISMIASLELVPSTIVVCYVCCGIINNHIDGLHIVFVLLLKTLYDWLVVEYLRKIPSSLFASNFPKFP